MLNLNYQHKAMERIREGRRLLHLRYGAGKARCALQTIPPEARTIVIFCEKRHVWTWTKQIEQWTGVDSDCSIGIYELDTTPDNPAPHFATGAVGRVFVLVPHQRIRHVVHKVCNLLPDVMIFDEITAIKNPGTQISAAAHRIARTLAAHTRIIGLTGNAIPESYLNIWSQFQFLYPTDNPLGSTFYRFQQRFFMSDGGFGWSLRQERKAEFWRIVNDRTITMDPADVEEFKTAMGIKQTEYVLEHYDQSTEQAALMRQLNNEWSLPSKIIGRPAAEYAYKMQVMQKALQIADGFYYDDDSELGEPIDYNADRAVRLASSPKAEAVANIIDRLWGDGHRKIVVWHRYHADREILADHLAARWLKTFFTFLDSDDDMRTWADFPYNGIICASLKRSRGLNDLVAAAVAIYFSNEYSQEIRNQSEARLARLGQTGDTVTYIDVASPLAIDTEVVMALQNKSLTPERLRTIVNKYSLRETV